MDFYFFLFSLFFPRIVLLVYYFLIGHFPQSTIPFVGDVLMGIFIPRILILIFIYQNLGTNNIWFAAHLIALIFVYFGGTTRTAGWHRRRNINSNY